MLMLAVQQKKFTSLDGSVDAQGDLKVTTPLPASLARARETLAHIAPSLQMDTIY